MTDTITIEVVEQTTATVRAEIETLRATLTEEAAAFEARKVKIAEVATQLGNDNSIGSALDDLLEEFGMPRRPQRYYTQASVMLYLPMGGGRHDIPLHDGRNHRGTGGSVTRGLYWTGSLDGVDDNGCSCARAERAASQWVQEAYGIEVARRSFLQVGQRRCDGPDCESRDVMNTDPSTPFPDVPVVPWVPDPDEPVPPPVEPSAGETWYMVARNQYGTTSEEGDPVLIDEVHGGSRFAVTHPSSGHRWVIRREHIRATPEAVPPSFDDLL